MQNAVNYSKEHLYGVEAYSEDCSDSNCSRGLGGCTRALETAAGRWGTELDISGLKIKEVYIYLELIITKIISSE